MLKDQFNLKEIEQQNFYDLKGTGCAQTKLMKKFSRQRFTKSRLLERIQMLFIQSITLTMSIFILNTASKTRSSRVRPKKTTVTDVSADKLRNLYREPIALPKPLYDDMMSLCKTEAIPKHYHTFYNNLNCVRNSEKEIDIILNRTGF